MTSKRNLIKQHIFINLQCKKKTIKKCDINNRTMTFKGRAVTLKNKYFNPLNKL